ncbi:MAG: hypothetical protein AAF446_02245 [Pseudomonadota bacterium]
MISSLLALPGLVVILGGLNELSSDSEQLASLFNQLIELVQTHSDILGRIVSVLAALFSIIGLAMFLAWR